MYAVGCLNALAAMISRDLAAFTGSRAPANEEGCLFPWLPHCFPLLNILSSSSSSSPLHHPLFPITLTSPSPRLFPRVSLVFHFSNMSAPAAFSDIAKAANDVRYSASCRCLRSAGTAPGNSSFHANSCLRNSS